MMIWLKRILLTLLSVAVMGLLAVLTFGPRYIDSDMNPTVAGSFAVSGRAADLHETLLIGDWHADSTLWKRDFLARNDYGHVDLPRLQDGNVALQVLTAVTKSPRGQNYERNSDEASDNITLLAMAQLWPPRTWNSLAERAIYQAERAQRWAEDSDDFTLIRTRSELEDLLSRRASGQKIVGGVLGIEGAHALEGRIENLDRLEAAGTRLIGLQHFFDNEAGGSLHGAGGGGLSAFGREVVSEVERRGMILDVAHSSPEVVRDVLAMTDMPIVLSHGGLASHCPSPRNISDDLMRRIAASGGVLGMGFWSDVTCDDTPDGVASAIVAAIRVMGDDHVSLGSDYDGTVRTQFDVSQIAALTDALIRAGLSDETIAKVMGGNMVRVLRARLP